MLIVTKNIPFPQLFFLIVFDLKVTNPSRNVQKVYPQPFNHEVNNHFVFRADLIIEEKKHLFRTLLTLTIKSFSKLDVGTYTCISSNSLGRNEATIRVYGSSHFITFKFVTLKNGRFLTIKMYYECTCISETN